MNCLQVLLLLALFNRSSAALNATWTLNGLDLYINDLGSKLAEAQIDKLANTYFRVYPKLRQFYNTESSTGIRLTFDPNYKDVAETWGDEIRINPEYVQDHSQDLDFLTHELMHVVQFKKVSNNWTISDIRWLVEGAADYARDQFGINNKAAGWHLPSSYQQGQHYTQGYGVTAAFLKFLEGKYPSIVKKLFDAQYAGTYTDNTFKTITGQTLDQLWQTYVQAGNQSKFSLNDFNDDTLFAKILW